MRGLRCKGAAFGVSSQLETKTEQNKTKHPAKHADTFPGFTFTEPRFLLKEAPVRPSQDTLLPVRAPCGRSAGSLSTPFPRHATRIEDYMR